MNFWQQSSRNSYVTGKMRKISYYLKLRYLFLVWNSNSVSRTNLGISPYPMLEYQSFISTYARKKLFQKCSFYYIIWLVVFISFASIVGIMWLVFFHIPEFVFFSKESIVSWYIVKNGKIPIWCVHFFFKCSFLIKFFFSKFVKQDYYQNGTKFQKKKIGNLNVCFDCARIFSI